MPECRVLDPPPQHACHAIALTTSLQKRTAEAPGARRTLKTDRDGCTAKYAFEDAIAHLPLRTLRRCGNVPLFAVDSLTTGVVEPEIVVWNNPRCPTSHPNQRPRRCS